MVGALRMVAWAAALLATSPAGAAPSSEAIDAALIRRVRAADGPLTLARGATVFVEVEGRMRELPTGDLDGRVTPLSRGGGVSVVEWTEEVEIRPGRKGSIVLTHVIVRANALAPLGPTRASARVEIVDRESTRAIAVLGLDLAVEVVEPRAIASDVDAALRAYTTHQGRAEQGAQIVPPAGAPLRLDRVEMPPRGPGFTGSDRLALRAFLASRLRADIARGQLRALGSQTSTQTAVRAVTERAVRALGSLVDPPPRSGTPRPQPLADPARAVDQGVALFDRLELDWAQRVLWRARMTPALPPARLPEVLLRLGLIEAARGEDEAAATAIGQALCLRPDLVPPVLRPPMAAAFEEVRRRGRCPKPLAVHSIGAEAVTTEEGSGVRVRALVGPDPYHLVDRGTLELLDAADAVRATREVGTERGDLAALVVVFGEAEVGAREGDRVRVRLRAVDAVGLELVRQEATDLTLVQDTAPPDAEGVAWWIWVVGGVALAAAGTTTAVLLATGDRTPERTIGPIDVRF